MGSASAEMDTKCDKGSKMWRTALEVLEPETGQLEGHIPSWLTGSYYRVGPGKFDFENDWAVTHWFDGYALLARFDIDAEMQSVTFQSKYLKSDAYRRSLKLQRPAIPEFATPATPSPNAKKGFFSRLIPQIVPETTDNTNHGFCSFERNACSGSRLFTINGAGMMNGVDPVTLECLEQIDPTSHFGVNMCSAHPLVDSDTGEIYNIGFSLVMTGLKYNVLRIPSIESSSGEVKGQLQKSKIITSIPTQWTTSLSFLHSFGMTKHFIIFIEQPFVINLSKMLSSSVRRKPEAFRDWLEWKSDGTNRFYVIEKSTGRLINKSISIVSSELFFFLHFINCFEDSSENELVLDLSTYENADVILGASNLLAHVRNPARFSSKNEHDDDDELLQRSPKSKRFVISLASIGIDIRSGKVENCESSRSKVTLSPQPIIANGGLELATINKKFAGKAYQYFYASGLLSQGVHANSLCKVNVLTKEVIRIRISENYIFGEPIFASAKTSVEEDDGVLIVPMTDIRKDASDILFFFDARTMTEIAKVSFTNWIPPAIHGIYIPKL